MGRFARMVSAAQQIAASIAPPACALCRQPTTAQGTLCPKCWSEVAFLSPGGCWTCGRPLLGEAHDPSARCDHCLSLAPPWSRGCAVFHYADGGRRLVLGLKHGDRAETLPVLGKWLARAGSELLAEADVVVPVPLHWKRRLKRRFNQAASLAQHACKASGQRAAYSPRALLRDRVTPSQGHRSRDARIENVEGAFVPGPEARRMDGARVLLVDDVLTTGATLAECARTCLAAGAARVDVLVLALVVSDETSYMPAPAEDEDHDTSTNLYDPDLPLLRDGEEASGSEGRRLHRDQRDG